MSMRWSGTCGDQTRVDHKGTARSSALNLMLHCKKGLPIPRSAFIGHSPFAVVRPQRVPGGPAGGRCQHEQGRSRRHLSEGASALADQDTIVLNFGTQARADWRALMSAAFIGS